MSVLANIAAGSLVAIASPSPQFPACEIKAGIFRTIKGEVSAAGHLMWRTMDAGRETVQVDMKAPGFERRGIVLPVGEVRLFLICGKEVSMTYSWSADTMTVSVF